jgi:putative transposase
MKLPISDAEQSRIKRLDNGSVDPDTKSFKMPLSYHQCSTQCAIQQGTILMHVTKASIKWHASFDILTGLLVWFQLTPGKRHDSKCFPEITSLKGKLVIFDLGYWDYAVLHAIEKAEGFFLSRVKSNAVIKIKKVIQGLSKEAIGQSLLSLDLSRKKGNIIEVIIEKIHQGSTLSYRAIGFWNPVEKDYHWYITNLTAAAYLIYPLYRLRWQIELIFKAY